MHWPIDFDDPALTLALALAAGMTAQAVARHLRLPGIVLLLAAGILLGPDVLDAVRPAVLGDLLPMLIGFAVAVILFDGGMNLELKRLRRSARSIRRLITVGALVTWGGGALAARLLERRRRQAEDWLRQRHFEPAAEDATTVDPTAASQS